MDQNVINFLNQQVANFAVLYVKLHRYHWFIQGKHFFSWHAQFEEMYKTFAGYYDELAERILSLNGKPLATMQKYLKETTLIEAEAEHQEEEMLSELYADLTQISNEIERGKELCREDGDDPTEDLLIQIQKKLEKYAWMLRASLAEK